MQNNLKSLCGPFFWAGGGGGPSYHNRQIFLSRKEKEKEFFSTEVLWIDSIFDTQDIVKISELNSNDANWHSKRK